MRTNFYEKNTANFPRLKTDSFFADYNNEYNYRDTIGEIFGFIEEFQLLNAELWERFVQQFREDADRDAGWRGEYWGKMMRGACFVYSYSKNKKLYETLTKTVFDMIVCNDENGRISSYHISHEFDGWDMWGRKYVLLGMQYFLEICEDDEFAKRIIESLCKQVDYIMSKIGRKEDGKIIITKATRHWRGLNSSSILEPIVRLYSITGAEKYFEFAKYIVDCGGTDVVNIFELAYANEFYPYQYPVTKAYEMMSCFEGLLEFYRITGNERYKTAILNFADKVLESDFTVIGSSGCTHELFDHSSVRQANTTNGEIQQETCVTVTLMKFFYQLLLITGDPKYADAFEISLYNAYLGSINTEKIIDKAIRKEYSECHIEPLPFDSYSPLTSGTRGNGIGGLKLMSDSHYYGCCACIGAAGIGLVPKVQLLTTKSGFSLNLFINGEIVSRTPQNKDIKFKIETEYPKYGKIDVTIETEEPERFELLIRNPYWNKNTSVCVNEVALSTTDGYIRIEREWTSGDVVTISLDMSTHAIYPTPYGTDILMNKVIWGANYVIPTFDKEDPHAKNHIALRRGPVMLAQDSRLGYSPDTPISINIAACGDVRVNITDCQAYPNIVAVNVPLSNGDFITVTDYASAGKLWSEESKMAVWMLTTEW